LRAEEVTEEEDCITRNFIICAFQVILLGISMGRTSSAHRDVRIYIYNLIGVPKGKNHCGDLSLDVR
jgi:hypothetical protein